MATPPASTGNKLRPLNAPVPVQVRTGPDGAPTAVKVGRRAREVAAVDERWRIDEGWWWEQPVSRLYWRLILTDGRVVTVYQDLRETPPTWWTQRA